MQEPDIEQRIRLVQREVEAVESRVEEAKRDLIAAVDGLKIEIAVLRRFIEDRHPELADTYEKLRGELIQKMDPEWPGSARGSGEPGRE